MEHSSNGGKVNFTFPNQHANYFGAAAVGRIEVKRGQKGKCPFCEHDMAPALQQQNYARRNVYKCSNEACMRRVVECRTPGCHDYAKVTDSYDHELCPDCSSKAGDVAAEVGKAALKVVVVAATAVIAVAADAAKKENGK